jgi:Alpha/beta hydrolase domain
MWALLVALFEWAEHGTAPPDSRFPSRAAGTLVPLAEARRIFPRLPGVNFPNVLNELRLRDHSVEPPRESPAYPVFVQSTDADGNALGGIRHPLLAAPLATYVGWALRASGYGEGDLFTIQGSTIRSHRPKPSGCEPMIREARYGSRDAWATRLTEAVDRLVADRVLLAEDGDRLTAAARQSWEVYQEL